MAVSSIGPGAESVGIDIYAADPTGARWDRASWDGAYWAGLDWRAVGCDVGEVTHRWGAAQQDGILSLAQAGELDLGTIDPARELDPLNSSSPYYGYIRPGTPLRVVGLVPGSMPLATAYIDEASYDVATARGRIRAVDGIAYLAQAQIPAGTVLPNTLRARVRAIVAAVGLGAIVPVEPEAPADSDVDPPVAPHDSTQTKGAWVAITDAALDALVYVWVDPSGVLRFRSFGAFPDAALSIGCPPSDADPDETWLLGLSTIESNGSADAIRNTVRAYSSGTTWAAPITDGTSIGKYGPRALDVERVVPDRAVWAGRILADRADAGLEIAVGSVRPYTEAELAALLGLEAAGPSVVRVRDDEHGELIDLDVSLLGATVGVTPAGWRFALVTAISRIEWDNIEPEPPEPPEPPVGSWHVENRVIVATSDALLALTSGGAKYGAGAASSLPVGTWAGWTYRACIAFPAINWTGVRALRGAELRFRTTDQDRVGFGSSPTIEIRRITEAWTAGSASSPSSGNAVVYPGPATTSSGAVRVNVTTAEETFEPSAITAIARAWGPTSIGGSGAPQRGIMLLPGSSSGADTTEVWPVERGGSSRPQITLELEVFD